MLSYENRAPSLGQPTSDNMPIAQLNSTDAMSIGTSPNAAKPRPKQHIWLITGPAGCGKSTVAQFIAKTMNIDFIEGDDYHPAANVEKMRLGQPLTDADRWDWLTLLRQESVSRLHSGSRGVVLTCSALKRKYRDVIRVASYYDHDVLVHFVYLHATEEVLTARVAARKAHFMAASMVHSQFASLEEPGPEETDVMVVDVSGSIEEVEAEALRRIRQAVKKETI